MNELDLFANHLESEEKSQATIAKYVRDVAAFLVHCDGRPLTKQVLLDYKQMLLEQRYLPSSINSMLASVNAWLHFTGRENLRVRQLKIQKALYCSQERELSRQEYVRLLRAAQNGGEWPVHLRGNECHRTSVQRDV